MKIAKIFVLLCLPVLFLFVACKNDTVLPQNDTLTSIPESASAVTAIKLQQLMDKADFDRVRKMAFYEDMLKDVEKENAVMAKALRDPKSSGIDFSKNAYITHHVSETNPNDQFATISFSIADVDAFEQLVAASDIGEASTLSNYKTIMDNKGGVAWNTQQVILGAGNSSNTSEAIINSFFETTKENSIANNSDLKKCLANSDDIVSWVNTNALAKNPEFKSLAGLLKIKPEDLLNNYMHASVNFDKGEINSASQLFLKKGLTRDLDLFFKDKVTTDFTPYIPSENLGMITSMALDIKGINQVLAERPFGKAPVNNFLKQYGMTVDDLAKALDGDMAVAVYPTEEKEVPKALLAAKISDQSTLQQFIDLATEFEVLTKTADGVYAIGDTDFGMPYSNSYNKPSSNQNSTLKMLTKDDMIFFSNDDTILATIKSGGFKKADRIDNDISDWLAGNIVSSYVNFEFLSDISDLEEIDMDDFKMNFKRRDGKMTLRFKDKEINSLKNLFEMLNKAYLSEKNNTKKANI